VQISTAKNGNNENDAELPGRLRREYVELMSDNSVYLPHRVYDD